MIICSDRFQITWHVWHENKRHWDSYRRVFSSAGKHIRMDVLCKLQTLPLTFQSKTARSNLPHQTEIMADRKKSCRMQSWILRNGSGKNPYSAFQQWTKHQINGCFSRRFQFKSYHSTSYYNINSEQIKLALHLGGKTTPLISVFFSRFKLRNIFTPGRPLPPRWWETPPLEPGSLESFWKRNSPRNALGERVKKMNKHPAF